MEKACVNSVPDSSFRFATGEIQEAQQISSSSPGFLADSWRRLRKNRAAVASLILLVIIFALAFSAPLLAPWPPNQQNIPYASLPPRIPGVSINGLNGCLNLNGKWIDRYALAGVPDDVHFFFGTDEFGRDLFSRALYGTRISLFIAVVAAVVDLTIGIAYGLFSAMKGGRTDTLMQRFIEILSGIPNLVLVVLMLLIFEPGAFSIILALVISAWTPMARMVRAQALKVKELEYVQAARALGCSSLRIAISHVLPNISGIIVVRTMFSMPTTRTDSPTLYAIPGTPPTMIDLPKATPSRRATPTRWRQTGLRSRRCFRFRPPISQPHGCWTPARPRSTRRRKSSDAGPIDKEDSPWQNDSRWWTFNT